MLVTDAKWLITGAIAMLILAGVIGAVLALWLSQRSVTAHRYDKAPFAVVHMHAKHGLLSQNALARDWLGFGLSEQWLQPIRVEAQHAARNGGHTASRQLRSPEGRVIKFWVLGLDNHTALIFGLDQSDQQRSNLELRDFAGTLSHELRTPLTAMLAHAQIAQDNSVAADTRAASLTLLERETQRISRLVQELATLTRLRLEETHLDCDVDCVLVAEDAVSVSILEAENRGIALDMCVEPGLPRVCADRDRLCRVFTNLLDNAVKYCRVGDQITVSLSRCDAGVCCDIRDSGPGIPPQHRTRVTERLYRGRRDVEGSGLGLAIVQSILQTHQSQLQIKTYSIEDGSDNTGTSAFFYLHIASPNSTGAMSK
jgi:signal transduction histidine kinase